MKPVATLDDILAIEAQGMARDLPDSTYDLIGGAPRSIRTPPPFFLKAESLREAEVWTYRELLGGSPRRPMPSTRSASARTTWSPSSSPISPKPISPSGADRRPASSPPSIRFWNRRPWRRCLPPSGPRSWSRWRRFRGPTFGPVCSRCWRRWTAWSTWCWSIRPTGCRPAQAMARRLQAREVETLCGPDGIRGKVPPHIGVHDFWSIVGTQPDDRLISGRRISPGNRSSFFCTGGTTGLPKIAMRSHGNEVANAVSVGRFLGDAIGPGKTTLLVAWLAAACAHM